MTPPEDPSPDHDANVPLRMPQARKDLLELVARAAGSSVNGFVNTAIEEAIERRRGWPVFQRRVAQMRVDQDATLATLLPVTIIDPGGERPPGAKYESADGQTGWMGGPAGCASYLNGRWCVLEHGHEHGPMPDCFHRDSEIEAGANTWRDESDPWPLATRAIDESEDRVAVMGHAEPVPAHRGSVGMAASTDGR